jgi:aspartate/methionine/tyrosine aminotransferase
LKLNPLVAATKVPPISEAKAAGAGYDGSAGPLIDLSQAAPNDPPPPEMLARLAESAMSPSAATYGDVFGDPDLRAVYAGHMSQVYGGTVVPEEVAITAGCNMGFVAAAMALAKAGDAIVLPSPWYFNHKMTLDMLGIGTVALPCRAENGFVPDPREAEGLIDGQVRAIALVTPNNPTGAIYPPAVVHAFAELCARHGIALIIDETYRDFIDPAAGRPHDLFTDRDWRRTVVHLYSFSKAYCIPGHRVGAMTADAAAIGEVAKVLDCLQICPPRVPQRALVWAIDAVADWRAENRRRILERAAAFQSAFAGNNDWPVASIGAYFAYVRHPFSDVSGDEVAAALARERGVLGLSGASFGEGQGAYLRLAFANVDLPIIAAIPARLAGLRVPAHRSL